MADEHHNNLSRRERQIMDVLYARKEATAAQVQKALPQSPSYSTVRALLKKLLDKQQVTFRADGPRYVYRPLLERAEAQRGAVRRVLDVFFNGSRVAAAVNLLGDTREPLSRAEIERLESLVTELKERSRDD